MECSAMSWQRSVWSVCLCVHMCVVCVSVVCVLPGGDSHGEE